MKNSLETKLGVFVALTIIVAVLIVEMLGSADVFTHGKHVIALFETAQDLKPGDRVKMAGVEIGRVVDISLTNSKVSVVMKLHDGAAVKTDSLASIKFTGLMGQNFVSLTFGGPGSPPAEEGTVLKTKEQADLSVIMDKLDQAATGIANLGNSFSGEKIDNLVGPLVDFVKQNSAPLTATIANVKNVSSQIAAGQGTIGKLIYDESLYNSAIATVTNLQETAGSAKDVLATAKGVMNDVNAGKGTVGKLLTDDTLYKATTSSMTNLNSILSKINNGEGTIGTLVNNKEFYNNAKLSLQKLDKAADSLEDTGPLSVIGIMAHQFGL